MDVVLTGDRPTGPLHLGHYAGSLEARLELQEKAHCFVLVADLQALTDHADSPELIRKNVTEVVLDYLAIGLDPAKCSIVLQSAVPELCELSFYFMNLVTVAQLGQNPTLKQEIRDKQMSAALPLGFFTYPVSQAADILGFRANLVPVGEDQRPLIEQTKAIANKFNNLYTPIFDVPQGLYSLTSRLIGIDGQAKASKTQSNAIFLGDSEEVVRDKVNMMFTDPNHLRVEDPGCVEGNVVFSYLDAFHPNHQLVEELKIDYQAGGIGDSQTKEILLEALLDLLAPIRTRRQQLASDLLYIEDVLQQGTSAGRARVQETLVDVRLALGLRQI